MAGPRGWIFVASCTALLLLWLVHRIQTGRLRSEYAILWAPVGLALGVFGAWPPLIDRLAAAVGIAYAPSLLIVLGGAFTFVYLVPLSERAGEQRARTRRLAQELAILRARLEAAGLLDEGPEPPGEEPG